MEDRYRKHVDKRAIKMPMRIDSGFDYGVSSDINNSIGSTVGRKFRKIITNIIKTKPLDLLLSPFLFTLSSSTSYFKQKTAVAFQFEKSRRFLLWGLSKITPQGSIKI